MLWVKTHHSDIQNVRKWKKISATVCLWHTLSYAIREFKSSLQLIFTSKSETLLTLHARHRGQDSLLLIRNTLDLLILTMVVDFGQWSLNRKRIQNNRQSSTVLNHRYIIYRRYHLQGYQISLYDLWKWWKEQVPKHCINMGHHK